MTTPNTPRASGIPIFCAFTEVRRADSLKPHPRNANRHPQDQIELFAKIVSNLGWRQPIVVSKRSGYITKGHGRLAVANLLKLDDVPIDLQEYATEEEEWQDLLADNRIAELSDRDESAVASLLRELGSRGAQLELTGYESKEVALLLARLSRTNPDGDVEPDLDHAGELRKKWATKLGQVWALGDHRLSISDATDKTSVLRLLDSMPNTVPRPKLMVTDPPYGVNYDPTWRKKSGINKNTRKMGKVVNDSRADWTPAWKLFTGDVAYVWHGGLHGSVVEASLHEAGLTVRAQIIWRKDRFALSRGHYHWQHEPCFYAVRDGKVGHWTGDRGQSTVWDMPAREDNGLGHSTPKPLMAMRRPIENNSLIGDSVYEPFLGSGTTLVACEQTGRIAVCSELDPAFAAVSLQRWADLTKADPKLLIEP